MTRRGKEMVALRLGFWTAILSLCGTVLDNIYKIFSGITSIRIDISSGVVFPVWLVILILCLLTILATILIYKKWIL